MCGAAMVMCSEGRALLARAERVTNSDSGELHRMAVTIVLMLAPTDTMPPTTCFTTVLTRLSLAMTCDTNDRTRDNDTTQH